MTTRRRGAAVPVNQARRMVVDFADDPRGTAMFGAVAAQHQLAVDGHDGLVYVGDVGAPERSWNGDLGRNVQAFTGAAALALYGAAKPYGPAAGTFETAGAADALNDAPMRIFAARAARKARR